MKINYPEDFFDFRDGVQVYTREIQSWIDECINKLKNSTDNDWHVIGSGNTKVIVLKILDENNDPHYDVTVATQYLEYNTYG